MTEILNRLKRTDLFLSLALAIVAFLAYIAALTPSLSYQSPDGNELATIPYVLGLTHPPGYPLYTWLGKIFTWLPFGDVAYRMNLMSAICAACAVAGLYLIVCMLLQPHVASSALRRASAAFAALMLAFSPTFWSQAVIAEVYAANAAMIVISLLLLLRWETRHRDRDFFLFALVYGLSLGTHISNLGFAPAIALYVLLTDRSVVKRPSWWVAAVAGFSLGAAQYLWLPLRAAALSEQGLLRNAPLSLKGFYDYTLGAFPQLKFAFELSELPDRVVVYIYLLWNQFSFFGILLGVAGLFALLCRRTRHYYLLMGMYLVHTWFFIQYRAFDLEVFFIPAHILWAIFIAFGMVEVMRIIESWLRRLSAGQTAKAAGWTLAFVVAATGFYPLTKNFSSSDRSDDVNTNDFYANVWEYLPENSTLLSQGGVMGYDAFYWQLVYGTRPDVVLPALPTHTPSLADIQTGELFSTTPLNGINRNRTPGALPKDALPADVWQTPVLVGNLGVTRTRNRLVLYQLGREAPYLVVDDAQPEIEIKAKFGNLTLLGADISGDPLESGACLHLILYWTIQRLEPVTLTTYLDQQPLETHELGFGNLPRYATEIGSVTDGVIVEDYWLVVPSTVQPGPHTLNIQIQGSEKSLEIGSVEVINEEETMERWLRIAN
jgi:MFS family permease